MQDSLVLQSKELIQKLSKNCENKTVSFKNNDTTKTNKLLHDKSNKRPKNEHSVDDSIPQNFVNSVLSRSAYFSRSMPKRYDYLVHDSNINNDINFKEKSTLDNTVLLGYDWIASMMENSSKENQLDKPDLFYEEIDKFRRNNKKICISEENRNYKSPVEHSNNNKICINRYEKGEIENNFEKPIDLEESQQPQVYTYTLNDRLFPVPLDIDTANRPKPTKENPHIIKISMPSNRFLHPRIRAQTTPTTPVTPRKYKDSDKPIGESIDLRSHCNYGYSFNHRPIKTSQAHNQDSRDPKNHSRHLLQEPAGLRGNLIGSSVNSGDWLSPFDIGQPRSEQEAVDQLIKGKTGARLARKVPSQLTRPNRSIPESSVLECRIALKDIDDFTPRNPQYHRNNVKIQNYDIPDSLNSIPSGVLSRKTMNRVYENTIQNISNSSPYTL